jgi:hypothetical protein
LGAFDATVVERFIDELLGEATPAVDRQSAWFHGFIEYNRSCDDDRAVKPAWIEGLSI